VNGSAAPAFALHAEQLLQVPVVKRCCALPAARRTAAGWISMLQGSHWLMLQGVLGL
jgi:hypothetical protein